MKPKEINDCLFTSIVANAMQFVELMYECKEVNETLERLEKDFAEKYGGV